MSGFAETQQSIAISAPVTDANRVLGTPSRLPTNDTLDPLERHLMRFDAFLFTLVAKCAILDTMTAQNLSFNGHRIVHPVENCTRELAAIDVRVPIRVDDAHRRGISTYATSSRGSMDRQVFGVRMSDSRQETLYAPAWADSTWIEIHERARAVQLVRPESVVVGAAAGVLLGFALPRRLELAAQEGIEIAVPPGTPVVRRRGVRGRRFAHLAPADFFGVRVDSVANVIASLAGDLTEYEATAVLDGVVGPFRSSPVMSRTEIADALRAHLRYRGKRVITSALARARDNVRSPRETTLRLQIVDAGLPEPRVAAPVHLIDTPSPVHPDLSYEDEMIAIEYDGHGHWNDEQRTYDATRYAQLGAAGWLVLTVTKHTDMDQWLDALRTHLGARRGLAAIRRLRRSA